MAGLAWFQRNHTFPLACFQRKHSFGRRGIRRLVSKKPQRRDGSRSRRWCASRKEQEMVRFAKRAGDGALRERSKRWCAVVSLKPSERMDPGDGSKRGPSLREEMGGLAWFQRNHTFPFPLAFLSLSLGVPFPFPFPWRSFPFPFPLAFLSLSLSLGVPFPFPFPFPWRSLACFQRKHRKTRRLVVVSKKQKKKPQKNQTLGCGFKETKKETTEKPLAWLWFQRNQKRNHSWFCFLKK